MQRDTRGAVERGLLGEPERSGGEASNPRSKSSSDREVLSKPQRRRFTAEYKLKIVESADKCTKPGEIGALLRKEGLYSSHLRSWRKQRDEGALSRLRRKRGRKSQKDPLLDENKALRRQVEGLQHQLKKAEAIIEVQKKLSEILGDAPLEGSNEKP